MSKKAFLQILSVQYYKHIDMRHLARVGLLGGEAND